MLKKKVKCLVAFSISCMLLTQAGIPFAGGQDRSYGIQKAAAQETATTKETTGTTQVAESTTKDSSGTTQAQSTTKDSAATTQAQSTTKDNAATTQAAQSTTKDAATTTQAAAATTAQAVKPEAVKELRVSEQTMTSITVSWDAVAGMDGYVLQTYNYTTKAWDPVDTIVKDDTKKTYTYVVSDLNAGTTHRFRMYTYVGNVTNSSPVVKSIKTGCVPGVSELNVTAGDKSVRLDWQAVKCTGYNIYRKKGNAGYEKIDSVASTVTTYHVSGLTNGEEYIFKVCAYSTYAATDDGVSYSNTFESQPFGEYSVKPAAGSKTSATPYLFATQAKFKASSAYKTYALAKKINFEKSFITPGLAVTNANGINSSNFVPEGTVCAKTYYLIGAYDKTGAENSVIYIMRRSNHKYVMTLTLPNKEKITDMAFDGTNIWMTAGDSIACVKYNTIASKASTGAEFGTLSYMNKYTTVSKPGYIGYYDGKLWVGSFATTKQYMKGYTIGSKTTKAPTLTYTKRIQIPAKTRAITIDTDGRMYIVRSYQVRKGLSGYISEIRSYNPTWSKATSAGTIKKNTAVKVCKLPAMACGVSIYNTFTYINFSSAKESDCKYPVDRSFAIKTKKYLQ